MHRRVCRLHGTGDPGSLTCSEDMWRTRPRGPTSATHGNISDLISPAAKLHHSPHIPVKVTIGDTPPELP